MKRFLTAQLAACAIALPAVRAAADENPQPPTSGTAQAAPAPRSTVSTTVVVAGPVVSTGHLIPDLFLNLFALGVQVSAIHAIEEQHRDEAAPTERQDLGPYNQRWRDISAYRRKHDAREGFLFSFGVGGGQMRYSGQVVGATANGPARTGSVDLGLRMGYGFSDRFQLFGDLTADVGQFQSRQDATSWILSLRGQTVLIGDRDGNGLNLNLGVGIGGLSINYHDEFAQSTYPTGIALVSGLSYDARVGQQFALSPELYVNWHLVPNDPGFASDNLYTVGLRLNFLWYAP
jgi:hypothetical protein